MTPADYERYVAALGALVSDHDGLQAAWVCDRCGQALGQNGLCNSGLHVGPDDADDGPNSGHAVATTDLVAERNAALERENSVLEREQILREEFTVLIDACGHCMAAGRPPNEGMIAMAREALQGGNQAGR